MRITPDGKNPTASGSTLKSGYGIQETVTARVSTSQSSATTPAQNAVTYFPEFQYGRFWRLLGRTGSGYQARFEFQENEYSTYQRRTHFTPIWYPDGSYTPYTWLIDSWTPAGMLSMNLSASVSIRGICGWTGISPRRIHRRSAAYQRPFYTGRKEPFRSFPAESIQTEFSEMKEVTDKNQQREKGGNRQ